MWVREWGHKELISLFAFASNNNKYLCSQEQILYIDGAGWDERELRKRLIIKGSTKTKKGGNAKRDAEGTDTIDQINMLKFKFLDNRKEKPNRKELWGRQKASSRRREKIIVLHCSEGFSGGGGPPMEHISRACVEIGSVFLTEKEVFVKTLR